MTTRFNELDLIILPVIGFLTIFAGVIGLIDFFGQISFNWLSIIVFLTSIFALGGGYLLTKQTHLGWLLTLLVILISFILLQINKLVAADSFDPLYFVIVTLYYAAQAIYLIERRELFELPYHWQRDLNQRLRQFDQVTDTLQETVGQVAGELTHVVAKQANAARKQLVDRLPDLDKKS
ncbi:MAG: hypothetical protein CEO22_226 [Candidatus Berkelbacteria bacterium Gr01-1014_85]|uniref:Uncharacterized protein n=1 Tax=Candidatus Berkelbacteria bacterium Gr01-1014_85 TaxID=2017150 RepID=A0A554JCJ4_9BACT|nr:MAG: hypothetical protein CEO22_226 [Candidatus Berkelbacteria bacterium Gr01-1014_85]